MENSKVAYTWQKSRLFKWVAYIIKLVEHVAEHSSYWHLDN
jgi:hypothetical protein